MSLRNILFTFVLFSGSGLGLGSGLAITPAFAQGKDPTATADTLFQAGQEAIKHGDYATARAKFAESQQLDPAVGTLINLSVCDEKLGDWASAWAHIHQAIEQMKPDDDRLVVSKKRHDQLTKHIATLTLRLAPGAPKGTKVMRDGTELSEGNLGASTPVNPGQHMVVVVAPGRKTQTTALSLREGETTERTLEPSPAEDPLSASSPKASASPSNPSETGTKEASRSVSTSAAPTAPGRSPTLGYVVGGMGLVSLGVSGITGLMVLNRKSIVATNCSADGHYCDPAGLDAAQSGKTLSTISTAAFAAGVIGVGAGIYLILSTKQSSTTVAVGPAAFRGGGGLSFIRAF